MPAIEFNTEYAGTMIGTGDFILRVSYREAYHLSWTQLVVEIFPNYYDLIDRKEKWDAMNKELVRRERRRGRLP